MAESDGFVRYCGLDLSSSEDDTTVIADSSDSQHSVEEISEQDELPQPAAIARKRSVASNSSEKPQARTGSDKYLKNLSNAVRISEHPGEYLERRDFKLFCGACRQWLSEKKSSVVAHVSTKKHIDNRKERSKESCKQISVMAS